ncbi:hypothetical protein GC177_05275 [bacterium]|nr:hypothetical protein [bacterium]
MRLRLLALILTLAASPAFAQEAWKTQRYDGSANARTVDRATSGTKAYDPSQTATPAYDPKAVKAKDYNPKDTYNPETYQSEADKKKEKEEKEKKKKRREALQQEEPKTGTEPQ